MDLGSIILYLCFISVFIASVWGLFNFEAFFKAVIKFFDSQNTYDIVYPKEGYAIFVIKTSLILGTLMGLVATLNFLLILLGTSLQELIVRR